MDIPAVLGIGQIKIAEHWDKSLRELAGEAAFLAMEDAKHPSNKCSVYRQYDGLYRKPTTAFGYPGSRLDWTKTL